MSDTKTEGNGKDLVLEKLDEIMNAVEALHDKVDELQERVEELDGEGYGGYSTFDSAQRAELYELRTNDA